MRRPRPRAPRRKRGAIGPRRPPRHRPRRPARRGRGGRSSTGSAVTPAPTAAPGAQADAEALAPVRGTLLDQERHPVAEVSVTFVPQSGKGIYQAFSGEDGKFTFGSLPAGRYRVLVASPGHV